MNQYIVIALVDPKLWGYGSTVHVHMHTAQAENVTSACQLVEDEYKNDPSVRNVIRVDAYPMVVPNTDNTTQFIDIVAEFSEEQ